MDDAVQGIEAGKAAGMRVVAITTTRNQVDLAEADFVVDSLAELRAYPNNASAFVMLSNAKHLAIGNPGANVL